MCSSDLVAEDCNNRPCNFEEYWTGDGNFLSAERSIIDNKPDLHIIISTIGDGIGVSQLATKWCGATVRIDSRIQRLGHSESKGLVCMERNTGKVVWNEKGKAAKGSICSAEGMLYYRAEAGKGTFLLAEATPTGFVEKGRFDQPDRTDKNSWPHPVVSNGKLYLRDQDLLLCYDVKAKGQ